MIDSLDSFISTSTLALRALLGQAVIFVPYNAQLNRENILKIYRETRVGFQSIDCRVDGKTIKVGPKIKAILASKYY